MSSETQTSNEKKSHGCLIAFIVIIAIIAGLGFGIYKLIEVNASKAMGNTDGNTKLLSRSANNNDIICDSTLDLSSFGAKFIITPQTDIENLSVKVTLTDKNKKALYTTTKSLGNVKEGISVNFSLSIMDIGLSASLKGEYVSISVVGGTVSYFS